MSAADQQRSALRSLIEADDRPGVLAALSAGSGLPGPRANLTLMAAFADLAPDDLILDLVARDDEYLRCCGTVGLGRLLVDGSVPERPIIELLLARAADDSWRVREAAAMALQRVGDAAPARFRELVTAWSADADPLVRRAAVAAICEPRLLRDPDSVTTALDACTTATAALVALTTAARRDAGPRTLRQALGYGWSVVIAADPARGLPVWRALRAEPDPEVAWIVRENEKKARLARILFR